VPLRDIAEDAAWVERESPSIAAQYVVRCFLVEVGDEAWRAPSVPIGDLSDQPQDEMRSADVPVPGERSVWVWYRHFYTTGAIDIIAITNR
jgi:hypothetical protein